ncbi:MAG: DUF3857 domain-containing transglutaminase family protein [Chthonomonadales bacterium]
MHYRSLSFGACSLALLAMLIGPLPARARQNSASRHHEHASKPVSLDPELQQALRNAPAAAQWPNSNYARLLDLANVRIRPDGTVVAYYRETLKLFNERARSQAEVNLPYNSSYQSIKVLRARTITRDGRILEVSPSEIRVTSPYSEYPLYGDTMAVGFSMPGIEDDCVIDYTWQEITRPAIMPGHYWDTWAFTGQEPVVLSRYTLAAPANKKIRFQIYNDAGVKSTTSTAGDGQTRIYTWQLTNARPIEVEPAMPPLREIRTWMEVTTIASWQDIAQWFWKLASPQMTVTPAIRDTVARTIAGKHTDAEKAAALYDWVANRVRYVGLEFGLSAFKPHPAPDVCNKLYGDCKDKAILLIAMLQAAGIKAQPVLLQAQYRAPVSRQLPGLDAFDHCIAQAEVDGKTVWLDATAETCGYGDIPAADRGCQGFVITKNGGTFETIPGFQPDQNGFSSVTRVDLNPDGSAKIQLTTAMKGSTAEQWRAYIRSITPDQRKEVVQAMAQSFSPGGVVNSYTLPDGTDKRDPYLIRLALTAPNRAKRTRSLLIVPVANLAGGPEKTNPFVKERRIWPIVVEEANLQTSETVINLPSGYVIEDTPEDVHIACPLFEYTRTIAPAPDGRSLTIRVTSVSRPGRMPADQYAQVKAYYDAVLRASDDDIVLKKAP